MRIGPIELAALLGRWRDGAGSLTARLSGALRSQIASGAIPSPCALPTERALAEAIGCSRSTVTHAFDDLEADGLVVRRQGSGTAVPELPADPTGGPGLHRVFGAHPVIDLSVAAPSRPPAWLAEVHRTLDLDALDPAGTDSHGYESAGSPALRRAVAERAAVDPARVVVTNGAHHGLMLSLASVLRRGARVAIEDPVYPGVFDLAHRLDARVLPIDALGTADVGETRDRLVALRPGAVVVQSRVASPTGRVVDLAMREALADAFDAVGAPVFDDDALGDLAFDDAGAAGPLLHSLCQRASVWTVGSLSKPVWGGLRLGWLIAPTPEAAGVVAQSRVGADLAPSAVSQAVALAVLPRLDAVTRARRSALRTSASVLAGLLADRLPAWSVTEPEGGLTAWVGIGVDAERFAATALANGVAVTVGTAASRSPSARQCIRLCFDRSDQELSAGVARLERAWLAR